MKLFKEGSISKAAIEIAFLRKSMRDCSFGFIIPKNPSPWMSMGPCMCDISHAFDAASHFFRTPQQSPLAGKFAAATGEERPGAFHLWPSAP